jgi:hypothetical protein
MKLLLATLAGAAAVSPPRIDLNLGQLVTPTAAGGGSAERPSTGGAIHVFKLANPITRDHNLGLKQPNGDDVLSRQDVTLRCAVCELADCSNYQNKCKLPMPQAYDHQDKKINVETRLYLVDDEGQTMDARKTSINFQRRSTYLLKYDAVDYAGNHAEQAVVALILDDLEAPEITVCTGPTGRHTEEVEAGTGWKLCSGSSAWDNIDHEIDSRITYSVTTTVTGIPQTSGEDTFANAQAAVSSLHPGNYVVTLRCEDKAGVYGTGYKNNYSTEEKVVDVADTQPPTCVIKGSNAHIHECHTTYTDAGADCTDLLDDQRTDLPKVVAVVTENMASDENAVGDYPITYNARDAQGNPAQTLTRTVQVRDTTPPTVTLIGDASITHHSHADPHSDSPALVDPGATCSDTCDQSIAAPEESWDVEFNDKKEGSYIRTYKCTDASGNHASKTRTFTVVDIHAPVIEVLGTNPVTYEAAHNVDYTDKGATCHDYVDGLLTDAVQVTGPLVDRAKAATYTIKYDCADLSGNDAHTETRKVVIQDTTCPQVTVLGAQVVYLEAGFPYVDAGATATDTIDGDLTSSIAKDGDSVDYSATFYQRRSCSEIKHFFPAANTAEYYITRWVTAAQKFERVLVWCDMNNGEGRTYYKVTGGTAVTPYQANSLDGDCLKQGLSMLKFVDADKTEKWYTDLVTKWPEAFAQLDTPGDTYVCTTSGVGKDADESDHMTTKYVNSDRAEAGKYVIKYSVSDAAQNSNTCTTCDVHKNDLVVTNSATTLPCRAAMRTVIVKDNLPPVITLAQRRSLLTDAVDSVVGSHKRTAIKSDVDAGFEGHQATALMAESTSSSANGWVIGSIASAVTGLALLGLSTRRAAVATSVPV